LGVRPTFTTDTSGRLVEEDYDLPTVTFATPAGDMLYAEYSLNRDVVDAPFNIWPGVTMPAGDYGWGGFRSWLQTSETRPLSMYLNYRTGTFYSGTRCDYAGSLGWRPSSHFMLSLAYDLRQIRLCEGDFDSRLLGVRLNVTFNPDLSLNNFLQFDNQSGTAGLNSRLRWTFRPGSDLFLVFNYGADFDDWRLHRLASEVAVKLALTLRF